MIACVLKDESLNAVSAAADQTSAWHDASTAVYGSVHVVWSGLTGTLDAVVTVEVSNDGTNSVPKTGASLTISSASGSDSISLNGNLTEDKCRVKYTRNNVSGGTITCTTVLKG